MGTGAPERRAGSVRNDMRRPAWELILSFVVVLGITVWYVARARAGIPRPSGFLGHTLGIVGFLMMLSTETLYSIRKRSMRFMWGPTRIWLQVHVFTGIVGSYLVVLHSGWKFNGLAGVLLFLTLLVVFSGFVGRYIYTAVPRRLDGVEIAVGELETRIVEADARLQQLGIKQGLIATPESHSGWMLVLNRHFLRWREKRRWRQALREMNPGHVAEIDQLLAERNRLHMQIQSLAVARQLLSLWHLVHVPLGGMLFTLAFIHIGGALYYATFLR
jgi:hypothetical protein